MVAEALGSLTTRGRAFLAAGVASMGCALVLGQKDLLRVGILLTALPLVTTLVIARARYRLACTREIQPRRVPIGEPATVTLRLQNAGRMPTGILLLEDQVPYVLGARPRFIIDHMGPQWRQAVTYPISADVRGQYHLGPLSVRVSDPFGFVELTRSFPERSTMVVTPRVYPLPASPLSGEWSGTGDNRPRAFAAAGTEDVTVREYRQGDDLRRVHWPSTARAGELMVRREEQPWQSRATVVLDTRKGAHRGNGPTSSLEWAITAAASVGAHLARRGFAVRLASDADLAGGQGSWHDRGLGAAGETETLLEALAVVRASDRSRLEVPGLTDQASPGLVVAIVGQLDGLDVRSLGRLRQASGSCLAILVDTAGWTRGRGLEATTLSAYVETAAAGLRRQGWQVALARPGDHIAEVWEQLTAGVARPMSNPAPAATPASRAAPTHPMPQPVPAGATRTVGEAP